MKLDEKQQKLAGLLVSDLTSGMDVKEIAGQLDEIIFQFISDTGKMNYGEWFINRVWILEQVRNIFLVLAGGKMERTLVCKNSIIEECLNEV